MGYMFIVVLNKRMEGNKTIFTNSERFITIQLYTTKLQT